MIVQEGGKYVVKDSSGQKVLGKHDTEAEALDQLQAIEANRNNYKDGGVNTPTSMSGNFKKTYSNKGKFKKIRKLLRG